MTIGLLSQSIFSVVVNSEYCLFEPCAKKSKDVT